jgi:hypothetical protein
MQVDKDDGIQQPPRLYTLQYRQSLQFLSRIHHQYAKIGERNIRFIHASRHTLYQYALYPSILVYRHSMR